MQTVSGLTNLTVLDISSNVGITGALDSGGAADNLCKAVQVMLTLHPSSGMAWKQPFPPSHGLDLIEFNTLYVS